MLPTFHQETCKKFFRPLDGRDKEFGTPQILSFSKKYKTLIQQIQVLETFILCS